MFEIFIALFGSAYYGAKILEEKNINWARDKEAEKYNSFMKSFEEKYIPKTEEFLYIRNIAESVYISPQNASKSCVPDAKEARNDRRLGLRRLKMCVEVFDDDLKFIFGEDWHEVYATPKHKDTGYRRIFGVALTNLMLAKKLKVHPDFYNIVVSLAKYNCYGNYSYGRRDRSDIMKISTKMFQRCEQYFTDAGINDVKFLLERHPYKNVDGYPKYTMGYCYVLESIYKPSCPVELIRVW